MNWNQVGIVLMVIGGLALAYGTFGYNTETRSASVGEMQISVSERRAVNVPVWAGVGAIVVGGVLLLGLKKRAA